MKKNTSIYIALFLIICLFPSAGLLFAGIDKNAGESRENQELAPAPQLAADNRLNPNFLNAPHACQVCVRMVSLRIGMLPVTLHPSFKKTYFASAISLSMAVQRLVYSSFPAKPVRRKWV